MLAVGRHVLLVVALALLTAACQQSASNSVPSAAKGVAADPSVELAALSALYDATDGANWEDNTNWLSDAPVGEWHGVTVDDGGSVVALELHRNALSGPIPPELGDLIGLEELRLNGNQLSGTIPAELSNLANLRELRLAGNELTGEIPAELSSPANLTSLVLSGNKLIGGIPPELGNLANLRELWLAGNELTGEIPAELSSLANLTSLVLSGNKLIGGIPPELGNLANLAQLGLGDNQFSGSIPSELGNLAGLQSLWLSGNLLSGSIPSELGNLANLAQLGLGDNQFSGSIPSELGNLAGLQSLWLSGNLLSGGIPSELGSLAKLTLLRLDSNDFDGEIPAEFGRLAQLADLRLNDNQLTGEIPPQLGNLASLERLALGSNRLSGPIPPELGSLSNLKSMRLNHNRLTGEIPPLLVALPALTELWIEGNRVTGEVPSALRLPSPMRVAPKEQAQESRVLVDRPEISLRPVFGNRPFDHPIEIGAYPVGPDGGSEPGLFVAEKEGRVLLLSPDSAEAVELLNISDRVGDSQSAKGLLSVALDPQFEQNGHIWIWYTATSAKVVPRLSRFTADLSDLRRADPDTELIVWESQPVEGSHHWGGAVRFGPDSMLYLGLGDDGAPEQSQRLDTLWGSVIRIDVRAASQATPYVVPPDNPFVGVPAARPEIWAYGLRNPWRMAFDSVTGVLWAGDVGSDHFEEINQIASGGNYGWNQMEGALCVSPRACIEDGRFASPVATYEHGQVQDDDDLFAVVGGEMYRGKATPALSGHYLFSDHNKGFLWALPPEGGDVITLAVAPRRVSSFGTDADGEVYVLTFRGAVLRIEKER